MKLGYAIPHEIRIRASANMGFIVKVGCGEFVAANAQELIHDLDEYIANPKDWEKEYNELPSGGEAEVERASPPVGPSRHTSTVGRGEPNRNLDEALG